MITYEGRMAGLKPNEERANWCIYFFKTMSEKDWALSLALVTIFPCENIYLLFKVG